jgi:hypothetical protein
MPGNRCGDDARRDERAGVDHAAVFLGDDREVDEASAGTSRVLGEGEHRPAEVRALAPGVGVVAGRRVGERAHGGQRRGRFEQAAGGVAEHLLLFAQLEVHVGFLRPALSSLRHHIVNSSVW